MGILFTILIMIILGLVGAIWLIKQFQDYASIKDAQILEITKKAYFHRGQSEANQKIAAALGTQNGQIVQTILTRMDLNLAQPQNKSLGETTSPPPQNFQNVPNDAQNGGTRGRGDAGDATKKIDKREMERLFHWSPTVSKIGTFTQNLDLIVLERLADGATFWAKIPSFYDKDGNANELLEPFISEEDKSIKLFAGACQEKTCATIFITQEPKARFCSENCRKKDWKQNN